LHIHIQLPTISTAATTTAIATVAMWAQLGIRPPFEDSTPFGPIPSAGQCQPQIALDGIIATAHASVGALPLVRHQAYARDHRHSHDRPRRMLRVAAGELPQEVAQSASLVLVFFRAALG